MLPSNIEPMQTEHRSPVAQSFASMRLYLRAQHEKEMELTFKYPRNSGLETVSFDGIQSADCAQCPRESKPRLTNAKGIRPSFHGRDEYTERTCLCAGEINKEWHAAGDGFLVERRIQQIKQSHAQLRPRSSY